MEAGRVSQKRRFPKAMLLENSQVNLQHGRCKLTKRRCCVKPPPSVAVCGETEPAKLCRVVQCSFEKKMKLHRLAA